MSAWLRVDGHAAITLSPQDTCQDSACIPATYTVDWPRVAARARYTRLYMRLTTILMQLLRFGLD